MSIALVAHRAETTWEALQSLLSPRGIRTHLQGSRSSSGTSSSVRTSQQTLSPANPVHQAIEDEVALADEEDPLVAEVAEDPVTDQRDKTI